LILGGELTYALVTPIRDEAANLERLAASIDSQTLLPLAWAIVDNGSTDTTVDVATEFARTRPWVRVTSIPPEEGPPRPGAPIVRAFHAGLRELNADPSVIVKLDADISVDPGHFQHLLNAFAEEPRLGIASGTCLEKRNGNWEPVRVARGHVRGAVRAYRRECLREVLPLEERVGWDGIDELKASVLGWATRMLPDLAFYHHRPLGSRDGAPSARWRSQGEAAYYMGYRFPYLLLRSLHHARRHRAALSMISSYLAAAFRREPRYDDADVRDYLRRKQRLRVLLLERFREYKSNPERV
jgi:glycosyltransferase involved in cell wall biosynthesis